MTASVVAATPSSFVAGRTPGPLRARDRIRVRRTKGMRRASPTQRQGRTPDLPRYLRTTEVAAIANVQGVQNLGRPPLLARSWGLIRFIQRGASGEPGGRVVAWGQVRRVGRGVPTHSPLLPGLRPADDGVHRHLQVGAAQELPGEG
jgi:hypothetical protein